MAANRKSSVVLSILLCCLIAACKDKQPSPTPVTITGKSAFIVCEGSLGNGNSALTQYDITADTAYEDAYANANNGQTLGDVFQSIAHIGNSYYLCINNSDRIIVVSANSLRFQSVINVPKPRYIVSVSATKAYVSSLFSHKVYVLNTTTNTITDTITMPAKNPEGMLSYNNKLYICCWDTACNKLYQLDATTNALTDSITLNGYAPQDIVLDKTNTLWLVSGDVYYNKPAALTKIDAATNTVTKTYSFPTAANPLRPVFNPTNDTLYFIEANYNGGSTYDGVYRMQITDAALPTQAFVPATGVQYYNALGIDPTTGNIYIGDPLGFTQRGLVTIYNSSGTPLHTFHTGVGPGHIYFFPH